jgi:hypothetical protein
MMDLIDAIVDSWNVDTAYPGTAGAGHSKPHGQCAVTALVVQDHLGGTILRASDVPGHGSIYWNLIPAVGELDLTREQYPYTLPLPRGEEVSRSRLLEGERAIAAGTPVRYALLAGRVKRYLDDRVKQLREQRDEARAHARVLAHSYENDSLPPAKVVIASLAYPVSPSEPT